MGHYTVTLTETATGRPVHAEHVRAVDVLWLQSAAEAICRVAGGLPAEQVGRLCDAIVRCPDPGNYVRHCHWGYSLSIAATPAPAAPAAPARPARTVRRNAARMRTGSSRRTSDPARLLAAVQRADRALRALSA